MSKLVVIVGPTASGKTALAIEIAQEYNGEIICADSRTIYKGMDIGTAKPTVPERKGITHHLLDIVDPDQPFTVADFKQQADAAIADIHSRGKLPILVGGSGLYIDAVIYDFQFRAVNDQIRADFAEATIEELQAELTARGIPLPENRQNKRYLLRSLEAGRQPATHTELRPDTLVLGVDIDQETLRVRIQDRVSGMLQAGLVAEVQRLGERYGWDIAAMQAPAYKAFREYIEGRATLEEAAERFMISDGQLAKKQRTWFRRNNSIHWLTDPSKYVEFMTTFLNTR